MFLFISIFTFILLTIYQLAEHGVKNFNTDFGADDVTFWFQDYYQPKWTNIELIKSLSIILVSFSCQQNLFPIFSELNKKNNTECQKGFQIATSLIGTLYVVLAVISIYMFGKNVHSSILEDVGNECNG